MQNCTALRLKPASARAEDKARFGLVSYRTLADFIGCAFGSHYAAIRSIWASTIAQRSVSRA